MLLEADNGITVIDADGVKISNVKLITKNETAVEFYNTQNVTVEEFISHKKSPKTITVNGVKSANISLKSTDSQNIEKYTNIGSEVPANAVNF